MDRKKEIENLLSSLSEEDFNTIKDILGKSSSRPKKRRGRGGRKKKKKKGVKKKQVKKKHTKASNTPSFLDGVSLSSTESKELSEASSSDEKFGVFHPKDSPLKPRKCSKVEVNCRVCGKKEKISPALVGVESGRYKCNKCSCMAG